jgi:phosphate-selective porin OprO/OprP
MTLRPRRFTYALAALAMGIGSFAHGADDSLFTDESEPLINLTAAEEFAAAPAEPELAEPQDPADELKALRTRLDTLEKAEKKRIASETKKADEEKKKKDAEADWLDLSTDKWTVKLGGHVQLDYINWATTDDAIVGASDYFAYRRLRLVADGTGYGVFDFRLQMTLEPGSTTGLAPGTGVSPDVKDAYFSVNEIPGLGRVRIGNFFVPFGLEQVTNDTNNIFMERSIPTQGIFCADREVGIASYNCTDDQSLSWATGVFFDSITDTQKDRQDSNQGVRVSGRVNWVPYYDEPSGGRYVIHTGMGILHTQDQDSSVRFSARPQVNIGPRLIDTGSMKSDNYTIGNLEFASVMGPVTLQSEAYLTNVHMLNGDTEWLHGAYAHLSYFLTGEHRIYERFGQHGAQFGRNAPFNNFFAVPGAMSLGAWEAKTRWSYLNTNAVGTGVYNDLTVGMNWYLSDRVRVMFDWIHPITNQDTVFGTTQSNLLAMRMDFNW